MSLTIHTNYGDMKIELYCDLSPKACENFLALSASGYYNQTKFHKNIKGFALQGGDPLGTGKGGESIWGGSFEEHFTEELKHNKRGILSYAGRGSDKLKSQFFITYAEQPHLNNTHVIFGHVIDGMDILDAIERVPCMNPHDNKYKPMNPILLKEITIHANPMADNN